MSTAEFSLNDRLASTEGTVAMSGIEAVVRIPLDQHRADAQAGLRTAGLICGYRGSPVGGMDQVYERNQEILEANDIRFISGVNEDLGATAVWGSQLASLEPNPSFDGVLGMWYGKGPGVDRSGDAFRHANSSGVSPNGGVLAIAGDDPSNKSSTVPSASEWALADQAMPTLFPGNVQEVLDFGRFGYEMSRFCGAWVAMKFVTNVADGYMTVDPDPERITILPTTFEVDGQPWRPSQGDELVGAESLRLETELFTHRLAAAKAFVAAQGLDRTIGATGPAKLGIIAAGTCYYETIDALGRLGLTSGMLADLGIRIYKPAMIWPLEPTGLTAFATDVDELLVIEEKRAFIETQVRDILYGRSDAPRVLGKTDEEGLPLVKMNGALVSDDLLTPLRRRIARIVPDGTLTAERSRIPVAITSNDAPVAGTDEPLPNRIPHFCSGCPHNRSTVVPEGSKVGGGIGCHSMTMWMDRDTVGLTQMGGEGAQWVGMQPFIDDRHRFQNLGDGTFAHSGSLAIRQAVSAGTNVTYKLLYNSTVAMTGGQEAAGDMPVPQITRWLEAEGVTQSVVVAAEPDRYPDDADWAANTRVEPRDSLDDVQRELRDVAGTTVLIYDQECAAELRRGRKRGTKVTPTTRVMIDKAICEGCGHCGEVSNCASVHPVMTPFGRKTEIHQESCNFDLTCLEGNCPAFVSIEVDPTYRPPKNVAKVPEGELPPEPVVPDQGSLVFVGIGGTGVVTMSQVVSTAALLDGRATNSLDQTGLAQKGGTVVSNLRIFGPGEQNAPDSSNYIGDGEADALLLFDLVSGISPNILNRAASDRTVAVVSSALIPTGAMVSGRGAEAFPELTRFRQVLDPVTRSADNLWFDAGGIAQRIFASQPLANALLLGVAYQKGLVPVSGISIEKAIELNGVAVDANREAFRLGRRLATDQSLLTQLEDKAAPADTPPRLTGKAAAIAASIETSPELADILAWRIPELIDYQDAKYAQKYADQVKRVRATELRIEGGRSDLSQTVARHLFKLMAYKDEYEVARLALNSDIANEARDRFGPTAKVSYRLQPPSMKVVGYDKKIAVPEAAGRKMFAGLVKTKRLRGTRVDPFGQTEERRIERQLIDDYGGLIDTLLGKLGTNPTTDTYDQAVAIADLADQIRGYDTIKLGNVERYREAVAQALTDW